MKSHFSQFWKVEAPTSGHWWNKCLLAHKQDFSLSSHRVEGTQQPLWALMSPIHEDSTFNHLSKPPPCNTVLLGSGLSTDQKPFLLNTVGSPCFSLFQNLESQGSECKDCPMLIDTTCDIFLCYLKILQNLQIGFQEEALHLCFHQLFSECGFYHKF